MYVDMYPVVIIKCIVGMSWSEKLGGNRGDSPLVCDFHQEIAFSSRWFLLWRSGVVCQAQVWQSSCALVKIYFVNWSSFDHSLSSFFKHCLGQKRIFYYTAKQKKLVSLYIISNIFVPILSQCLDRLRKEKSLQPSIICIFWKGCVHRELTLVPELV